MSKTFDGMAIDEWGGRFSGTFDLEEEQADRYSVDDVVILVVRAQVKGANVKTTPQGDVKRVHVLGVEEVIIPSTKLWKECMAELRPSKQGQLPLSQNAGPPAASSGSDQDVIEVEEIEDVFKYLEPETVPKQPTPIETNDNVLREYLNS